ncbi:hypothetical protein FMK62_24520 [Klebsiella grimontii]|uniref:hypothetical protein n=1 Tax=Klebsiella grimontii TaxID=2058152 RepID=UPI001CCEF573|nr:hypothetical protein [Klebsiella grimontii]
MNQKLLRSMTLVSILTPAVALAFGNTHTWVSGWGQGHSEFIIKGKGESELYIACNNYDPESATLIFTDINGHKVSMDSGKDLFLKIDDEDTIDISSTESRVGDGNITQAWNHLRTGKTVVVSGDGVRPATFTLNGAGKVLPEFGTEGCTSKFAL